MIHTGIVQYLSEIDTNIFLSFNGIHSPFWDYFGSVVILGGWINIC